MPPRRLAPHSRRLGRLVQWPESMPKIPAGFVAAQQARARQGKLGAKCQIPEEVRDLHTTDTRPQSVWTATRSPRTCVGLSLTGGCHDSKSRVHRTGALNGTHQPVCMTCCWNRLGGLKFGERGGAWRFDLYFQILIKDDGRKGGQMG